MPKQPGSKSLQARFLKKGDIVRTNEGAEEVVRDIIVNVVLSNGNTEPHSPSDEIEVLPPEEVAGRERA